VTVAVLVLLVAILGVLAAQLYLQWVTAEDMRVECTHVSRMLDLGLGALLANQRTQVATSQAHTDLLTETLAEHRKDKPVPVVHIEHAHTAAPHGPHGPVR
jgi:hypothetical protein